MRHVCGSGTAGAASQEDNSARGKAVNRLEGLRFTSFDALGAQGRCQRRVVAVDLRQLVAQRMVASRPEEVVLREIDADQADAARAEVAGQVDRDEGGVVAVVQRLPVGRGAKATAPSQAKPYGPRMGQLIRGEDRPCL